jgi:hypothetical protein
MVSNSARPEDWDWDLDDDLSALAEPDDLHDAPLASDDEFEQPDGLPVDEWP